MKAMRSKSKSGLFLIELIIAITFFSITSSICIRLFVFSHTTMTKSVDLGSASLLAQSYAEQYKAMPYWQKQAMFYDEDGQSTEQYYYSYDKNERLTLLEPSQREDAAYILSVVHETDFWPVMTARIHVYKYTEEMLTSENVSLFSLDVKSYEAD